MLCMLTVQHIIRQETTGERQDVTLTRAVSLVFSACAGSCHHPLKRTNVGDWNLFHEVWRVLSICMQTT
jgi:hypothetical protein